MAFKKYVATCSLVFLAALLAACGSSAKDSPDAKDPGEVTSGGELKIAYSAQPANLDPAASSAMITAEIMGHVFETLLTTDSNYNIKPMLAESYEQSEDGKTITFKLREGILFHNGKEMVAEDVVASMNKWKDGPGGRGQFAEATFVADGDYTVNLNLPEPLSTALAAIAQGGSSFSAIMPKGIVDKATADGVDEYMGTGPFKFVEWKQDQQIHLTKFDDYQALAEPADGLAGKKEALVDDLYFLFVSDPSIRIAGLQTGQYDFAYEIPLDNVAQLESDANIETHIVSGVSSLMLVPNKKKGLFTDVRAREAIANALDMDEILTTAYVNEKYYDLNHNLMLPRQEEQWYSDIGKDQYNQKDTEKAKKLLEEAGYAGKEITILTSRNYEHMYNAVLVIQEQLGKIGMKVKLDVLDWATYLQQINNEDAHDMFVVWLSFKPEPSSLHILAPSNSGWTDNEELNQLLDEFRSQPTLEDAKPIYEKLMQWNWEYIPGVKIGDYSRVDATRNTVKNLQYLDRPLFWNVTNQQ